MQHYLDISISQMSTDFEKVREKLEIERWLVFGGSWGSTLGIQYAEDYADRMLMGNNTYSVKQTANY